MRRVTVSDVDVVEEDGFVEAAAERDVRATRVGEVNGNATFALEGPVDAVRAFLEESGYETDAWPELEPRTGRFRFAHARGGYGFTDVYALDWDHETARFVERIPSEAGFSSAVNPSLGAMLVDGALRITDGWNGSEFFGRDFAVVTKEG